MGAETGAAEEDFGVAHGDDLAFLFNPVADYSFMEGAISTEDDIATRKLMTAMWANFAKHGEPTPYKDENTPDWRPYSTENPVYMEIKPEPELKEGVFPARMYFWERFFWSDVEERERRRAPAPVAAGSLPPPPPHPVAVSTPVHVIPANTRYVNSNNNPFGLPRLLAATVSKGDALNRHFQ